jgi:hypothetical protein
MAASLERHEHFDLSPDSTQDGNKQSIRLKKWSVTKFLTLLKQIGEIIKLLPGDFDFAKKINPVEIGTILVTLGEESMTRFATLIKESVDSPKISETDVLSWTLEDFVGVTAKILEMNLTTALRKNFENLKEKLSFAKPVASKGAESVMDEAVKTATAPIV